MNGWVTLRWWQFYLCVITASATALVAHGVFQVIFAGKP